MKKILFICPTSGNGGIQSWTKKMLQTFSNDEFQLLHVNVSMRRSLAKHSSMINRMWDGMLDLISVSRKVKKLLKENSFSLMHTTTSGSIGILRDYVLVSICHKHGIPCILHCRYGCISEDIKSKGFWGNLVRKTMHIYDNVWVLDKRSQAALEDDPLMKDKVYLTPNSITVPDECDLSPKSYRNIAFIGNLIASKGIMELVHAVSDYNIDVKLTIAGPDKDHLLNKIQQISGEKWNEKIVYLGKLPNSEAVKVIKSMDMICLASYYPWEAFPISIIEAMSYGKFIIASRRAAIPDMLTDLDGNCCGYFVREQSADDIAKAIIWCQTHPEEADALCAKACYRTDVIYSLYRELYRKLIEKTFVKESAKSLS